MAYGGLRMRMLSFVRPKETKPPSHDLLVQNTIALVTFQPKDTKENNGRYSIQQIYLGVKDGTLQEIAALSISR
jgi:hypothetical protein